MASVPGVLDFIVPYILFNVQSATLAHPLWTSAYLNSASTSNPPCLLIPLGLPYGTDRDIIIQTMMLISSNQEQEFTSFRTKDIDAYVTDYADQYLDRADTLKEAMDRFDESFDEIKIPVTSIPQILYSGYRIIKDKKSFTKLVDKVADFCVNYDSNEEYKQFVQSGTGSKENVNGRFQYWRGIVKTLQ